jgi:hypothetical protein
MKVFVSWSGKRSRLYAEKLVEWLPRVINALKPWMSDKDIGAGIPWFEKIGKTLASNKIGLICVTPENMDAPWLTFEAGALSKAFKAARVCPILFGLDPAELTGPLSQFQSTKFEEKSMRKLLNDLNDLRGSSKLDKEILEDTFNLRWPQLKKTIEKLSTTEIECGPRCWDGVLKVLTGPTFPEPSIGRAAHFSYGFESHALYDSLCSFTQNRLYIFGRKNRKLFDRDHRNFFEQLKERLDKGFDFRCLFLDTESSREVLCASHQDADFNTQLNNCIANAISLLEELKIDASKICRKYQLIRVFHLIIADNAVLYTPIQMNEAGCPHRLTRSPFAIVDANEGVGASMVKMFEDTWKAAKPISIKVKKSG